MKQTNVLTFLQKMKVADMIRAHIEPDGDKHIRYKDGLTDDGMAQRAAAAFGWPVTEGNVVALRRQIGGKLRRHGNIESMAKARAARWGSGKGGKSPDGLAAEIAALRAEIVALRRAIEAAGFIEMGVAAQ